MEVIGQKSKCCLYGFYFIIICVLLNFIPPTYLSHYKTTIDHFLSNFFSSILVFRVRLFQIFQYEVEWFLPMQDFCQDLFKLRLESSQRDNQLNLKSFPDTFGITNSFWYITSMKIIFNIPY